MKSLAWLGALGVAMTLAGCQENYGPPPPYGASAPPPVANGYGPPPHAAGGYGAPAAALAPACFRTRDIRNHTVGDSHTLYINVNGNQYYRVEMTGGCLSGATTSDPIIIRNPPGWYDVCKPIDLDIGVDIAGFTNHCIVSSITPMTPNELAALPPKLRP
jgi:hypothetical protein